jgi:hypothetical protein
MLQEGFFLISNFQISLNRLFFFGRFNTLSTIVFLLPKAEG